MVMSRGLAWSVWRQMSLPRRRMWLAGLIGFLASASTVALLGASAWLIARAAEMPPVLTLSVAAVLVRTFAIGRGVFRYAERIVGHDAAFRGLTNLRVQVYERLERIAPLGLIRFSRGDLLTRLGADVDEALDLPLRVVLPWVQAIVVAAGTVAFVAWLVPSAGIWIGILAVAAVSVSPILVAVTARRADARMAQARADLAGDVVGALDAAPDIVAFGAQPVVADQIRAADSAVVALGARESWSLGAGSATSMLLQGAAVAGALALAIPAVEDGRLAPVWLAAVALIPLALFEILAGLPASALALQRVRGSARRLLDIEEGPDDARRNTDGVPASVTFESFELNGVCARWPGADADALIDVTLRVDAGSRVAVVGPSGSGKSTLAAVLMGFLPYTGSAALNGREISETADVWRCAGLLTQAAHVFDTTVDANIRLGDRDATDERIAGVLRQARLDSWVAELPDGLRTEVGAFGSAMSGGERQRLALARLLISSPSVYVLDEPTEHLDAQTAAELDQTIIDAIGDRSMIMISHRLSALAHMDQILVMEQGRLTAVGTHEELMSTGGWYADQIRQEAERTDMAQYVQTLPVGRATPAR